jgi:UDP-glucose:(heptosyl)LPS alpha-1,3-glucosyltransferase
MRISFFVPRCTPDNSHGRYVIELAKRMCGQHSVSVYAGGFWPPIRSVVRCRFLPVPIRPAVARLAALWAASLFATKRRPADIVHVQGADAPVGNVVTAHFCNSIILSGIFRSGELHRRFNYALGAAAERYCMSRSSTLRIIAVSGKVKGEIEREYGIDPRKVVVIHHGVDAEAFHPGHRARWRASVRDRLGVERDQFVVLFVGGDYRRKGLQPLLEAARRVSTAVKVLAVGVKPDAALTQFIRQNGLSSVVTFLGHTTDAASVYAAADCFALATRYDTFSLATLEAMASGLPVIVSRAAGVSEILTPGCDSLVLEDPDDVQVLAEHLGRMARDEKLRTSLGVEARKTAERHSWDGVAERTLAVYREVLATSR